MRVLFVNQHIESKQNGGDLVQMINTKEHLEKNYNVFITLCETISKEDYFKETDLIHIFNIQTIDYTYKAIKLAKKYGKKVILSTIFWDLRDASYVNTLYKFMKILPNNNVEKLKNIGDVFNSIVYKLVPNKTNIMFNKKKLAIKVLNEVDFLLPNSNEELQLLIDYYGLDSDEVKKKSLIVPNAVDKEKLLNMKNNDIQCINKKNYILQVGAINPVKNQLNLVRAFLHDNKIPIVIIGRCGDLSYYQKLRLFANKRGNVFIYDEVSNDEVISFYKNAACHILPSFRESPGLVSLEAIAMGIPIVVSEKKYCPIGYYKFEELATICNPYSLESIRNAVLLAVENKQVLSQNKIEKYLDFFSYRNAAKITYDSYKLILKEKI